MRHVPTRLQLDAGRPGAGAARRSIQPQQPETYRDFSDHAATTRFRPLRFAS